jgi:hypothetical protein
MRKELFVAPSRLISSLGKLRFKFDLPIPYSLGRTKYNLNI